MTNDNLDALMYSYVSITGKRHKNSAHYYGFDAAMEIIRALGEDQNMKSQQNAEVLNLQKEVKDLKVRFSASKVRNEMLNDLWNTSLERERSRENQELLRDIFYSNIRLK